MLRRSIILGVGAAIAAAVACGAPVELGATQRVELTGGASNDGAGGTGGSSGTSPGGTFGSGGTPEVDAAPDVEVDAGPPPMCQPIPLYEFPLACELVFPQPWADLFPPIFMVTINLIYRSPNGDTKTLGYVSTEAGCDGASDGYYLIQPWDPTKFVLCPDTCAALLDAGGQLFAAGGCLRSPAPRP